MNAVKESPARTAAEPDPAPARDGAAPREGRLICFVCTGNTCRSPMAAAVFNHLAARQADADAWLDAACSGHCASCGRCGSQDGEDTELPDDLPRAISAGISALPGDPISENAVSALELAGIPSVPGNDYAGHTAVQADAALLSRCDLIVGISKSHAARLMFAFPELAPRITFLPHDIPDPFGGSLETYRRCLDAIIADVEETFFPGD